MNKTVAKICETNDYSMFRNNKLNRTFKPNSELLKEMKASGWRTEYPMAVFENGKGYIIQSGHHRFKVAQDLNIPVKYVIIDNPESAPSAIVPERTWSNMDTIDQFADAGFEEYIKLRNFIKKYKFPPSVAIELLWGRWLKGGHGSAQDFRAGMFKVNHMDKAVRLAEIVRGLAPHVEVVTMTVFIKALGRCMKLDGFDADRFKQQAKRYTHRFEKRLNINQYVQDIETVYNMRQRNKLPIAVFAQD